MLVAASLAGCGAEDPENPVFEFALFGEMPYAERYQRFESLIRAVNESGPSFSIHIGDFKDHDLSCSDETYLEVRRHFEMLEQPLVYTPGDNEWMDCSHTKPGRFDSHERLTRLRELFFAEPSRLGLDRLGAVHQSDLEDPGHGRFPVMVENLRWRQGDVLFITINIAGKNNGYRAGRAAYVSEFKARNAANVAWIRSAFELARAETLRGMVIAFHGEMRPSSPQTRSTSSPFYATVRAITAGAEQFSGDILLAHGDSHRFTLDRPLWSLDGRRRLDNVVRIEVFHPKSLHAVLVRVDPRRDFVFEISPLFVGENITRGGPFGGLAVAEYLRGRLLFFLEGLL